MRKILYISLLILTVFSNSLFSKDTKKKGLRIRGENEPGKRWAVVIGINKYMDASIKELEKAQRDALDMSSTLRESGDFDYIFTFTDKSNDFRDPEFPTRSNIVNKIDTILREANENDFFLFYFSGHGISDPDGNGYLITIDANLNDPHGSGLKVDDIVAKLQSKGIKKNLFVLDACREIINKDTKSLNQNGLREKVYEESVVSAIFYSTKSGHYSYEHKDFTNGVYTHFLLEGMKGKADKDKNGIVTLSELEIYVQNSVNDWAIKNSKQQKPFTKIVNEKSGDIGVAQVPIPEEESNSDTEIKLSSRIKSSIVPGWGQWSNGDRIKGSIFFLGFVGFVAGTVSSYNNFQQMEKNYTTNSNSLLLYPSDPTLIGLGYWNSETAYSKVQAQGNLVKSLSIGIVAVYAINLVDIFFFGKKPSKTAGLDYEEGALQFMSKMERNPVFGTDSIHSVNYTWRF